MEPIGYPAQLLAARGAGSQEPGNAEARRRLGVRAQNADWPGRENVRIAGWPSRSCPRRVEVDPCCLNVFVVSESFRVRLVMYVRIAVCPPSFVCKGARGCGISGRSQVVKRILVLRDVFTVVRRWCGARRRRGRWNGPRPPTRPGRSLIPKLRIYSQRPTDGCCSTSDPRRFLFCAIRVEWVSGSRNEKVYRHGTDIFWYIGKHVNGGINTESSTTQWSRRPVLRGQMRWHPGTVR